MSKVSKNEVTVMDVREILTAHPEYVVEVEHKRWYEVGKFSWMLLTKGDAFRIQEFGVDINPSQPDTFGGFTTIKVYTPKKVYKAIARCSDEDIFCKKNGRLKCIDRLLEKGLEV